MQEEREIAAPTIFDESEERPGSAASEGSPHWISAAEERDPPEGVDDDESSDDFEFAFVATDPEGGPDITADEIFSNGRIRTVYPVFNRDLLLADSVYPVFNRDLLLEDEKVDEKAVRLPLRRLLIEEREVCSRSGSTSSSSSVEELEGVPPGTYCVWTPRSVPPSPDRCKKSSSAGSASRRWRIRDLVVGRSHSDGKEKFVFLAADGKRAPEKEKRPSPSASPSREAAKGKGSTAAEGKKGKGGRVTEVDMVTAHRLYYAKSGGTAAGGRRSFLPYKRDLVGFFGNVNGLSRTHY